MGKRRECSNCFTGYELQAVYVREADSHESVKWGQGRRKQKWIRIGTVCGYCSSFFPTSERESQRHKKIKDWSSIRKNGPPPAVVETKNYD
jgi:hypothetical protein